MFQFCMLFTTRGTVAYNYLEAFDGFKKLFQENNPHHVSGASIFSRFVNQRS